jgi:competence protein ComEA
MKKSAWLVVLGVIGGLLGAGLLYLVSRAPVGNAVQLLPPPTSPPMVIYITGEVVSPGLYYLSPGSRIVDAVDAAGGLTDSAETQSLNLAQLLTDGIQIKVPGLIENNLAAPGDTEQPGAQTEIALININTASQVELDVLPEIGPHLAGEIIAYRQVNGPFVSIDDILNVSGVGSATYDAIRNLITVGSPP